MKLLLTSDLHYRLRQFDWVLEAADDFDFVVLAGDFLDISSSVALEPQSAVTLGYLKRIAERTSLVAASGNHDLWRRNAHGEKFAGWLDAGRAVGALVDFESMDRDGVRVTVCPWWDGPATRSDVEAQLRAAAKDRPDLWLWVYHAPPSGSPTARGTRREYGDADLRGWIEELQPDIVLCGHVHEAPFADEGSWYDRIGKTWVFNAGRTAMVPIPNHVVLDLEARSASWFGGGETASVALEQLPSRAGS